MQMIETSSLSGSPCLGVVADDITGANDIGIMTAKAGYVTDVFSYCETSALKEKAPLVDQLRESDVCILDTDSRFDTPQAAYTKVLSATRELLAAGALHFFKKTCSVFRGNVGVEFDAMLDALDEDFAVVVVGFPKNGRQTLDGIHYVRGVPLAESEFRQDPVHPMLDSNLVRVLQSQTRRKVALVNHAVIARGATVLREHIAAQRGRCAYLLCDVVDQVSLEIIAQAAYDCRVFCGSSALGEELPRVWGPLSHQSPVVLPPHPAVGVLVVSGSLMPQTTAQIEALRKSGRPAWELDPLQLFDIATRAEMISAMHAALAAHLQQGEDVLLYAANRAGSVAAARREGARQGLTPVEVSRFVSRSLADLTVRLVTAVGVNRLVIAGGDTSAAVCAGLGVRRFRVLEEIQPGLPSCLALGDLPLLLVLKSGSFGTPKFLVEAVTHLREIACGRFTADSPPVMYG